PAPGAATRLFETLDELTVVPSALVALRTIDPIRDGHGDRLGADTGPLGFAPFVGVRPLPHVLHVGDLELLEAGGPLTLELPLAPAAAPGAPPLEEAIARLLTLDFSYLSGGARRRLVPRRQGAAVALDLPDPADVETVQGVGLAAPRAGRWVHAALPRSRPDGAETIDLAFRLGAIRVTGRDRRPDLAFADGAPVDVSSPFKPFGDAPARNATLAIASREAFSKPLAAPTLHVDVAGPEVEWEYFNGKTWVPLKGIGDGQDGRALAFLDRGRIKLEPPEDAARVPGGAGFGFRARVQRAGYRGPPRVDRFQLAGIRSQLEQPPIPGGAGHLLVLTEPLPPDGPALLQVDREVLIAALSEGGRVGFVLGGARQRHEAGAPVLRRAALPIGVLTARVQQEQPQIRVAARERIVQGESYLIGDGENREVATVDRVTSDGNEFVLLVTRTNPAAAHAEGATFSRLVSPLIAFADGREVDLDRSFHPFGGEAGVGRTFQLGWLPDELPELFEIDAEAEVARPTAVLRWEYLAGETWRPVEPVRDDTQSLTGTGEIAFAGLPDIAPGEVNGQEGHWLRARLVGGDYGRPVAFEPVDLRDPSRGFRIREDTGNLNPPVVESLSISYRAARRPTIVTENAFLFQEADAGADIAPFVPAPALPAPYDDAGPALYLGFDRPFPEQPVTLYVAPAPRQVSGRVSRENRLVAADGAASEPVAWDYFEGRAWAPLAVLDGTDDLAVSGTVKFLAPADMAPLARFEPTERFWLRARTASSGAFDPARLLGVFLNTVSGRQSEPVDGEVLGSGNETAGQTFRLARAPALADPAIEVREPELPPEIERAAIEREEGPDAVQPRPDPVTGERAVWVRWHSVPAFTGSGPRSRHYLLDHASGRVTFGDGERGMVLPRGTGNVVARYRTGGGPGGNVGRGVIAQIKSPLPGVAGVTNPVAADGGAEVESEAAAVARGPRTLSHRGLAVTAAEVEQLATEVAGTYVARARALANLDRELRFRPGWMTLLIVPAATDPRPLPGAELVRRVRQGLAARTFAGVRDRLNVVGPGYVRVTVEATVVPVDLDEAAAVRGRAVEALERFLHPLTGGPEGTGWAFGRDVYLSEVCEVLEGVEGLDHVEEVRLLAGQVQERLVLAAPVTVTGLVPEGAPVQAGNKAALLAEPLQPGAVDALAVKGFRPGDLVAPATEAEVVGIDGRVVDLRPDAPALVRRGGRIVTADGALRSAVLSPVALLPDDGLVRCEVEEGLAQQLRPSERVTASHPRALRVEAVRRDPITGGPVLEVEPFASDVDLAAGVLIASLDHRVRLPLRAAVPADVTTTDLPLEGFGVGERVIVAPAGREPLEAEIAEVREEQGIVYVDSNFLVTGGRHRIGLAFGET
ncbi:MAG TPA: putative baseplate assembly protein, partial [Geminicoccaceae bacterium]|nr:putative baseplate assembly protein [Geminicoccaceae bacterium]